MSIEEQVRALLDGRTEAMTEIDRADFAAVVSFLEASEGLIPAIGFMALVLETHDEALARVIAPDGRAQMDAMEEALDHFCNVFATATLAQERFVNERIAGKGQ